MSFAEPGSDDLNATEGSSWPTYSSPGVLKASRHSEWWLSQSGSPPNRPVDDVAAARVAAPAPSTSAMPSVAASAISRTGRRLRVPASRRGFLMAPPLRSEGTKGLPRRRFWRVLRRRRRLWPRLLLLTAEYLSLDHSVSNDTDLRDRLDEPVELVVGVEVVRRRTHEVGQAALERLDHRGARRRDADVDAPAPQRLHNVVGRHVGDVEGDDRAPLLADVADGDAVQLGELHAQPRAQVADALPDRLHSPLQRVVDRSGEPHLPRVVLLPLLEPTAVAAQLVAVRGYPVCGPHVDQRRVEPLEQFRADVQEARAPRRAQELAPRRGERIAADRIDVEGQLARRLAGVEEVRNPRLARDRADVGDRVH